MSYSSIPPSLLLIKPAIFSQADIVLKELFEIPPFHKASPTHRTLVRIKPYMPKE